MRGLSAGPGRTGGQDTRARGHRGTGAWLQGRRCCGGGKAMACGRGGGLTPTCRTGSGFVGCPTQGKAPALLPRAVGFVAVSWCCRMP